MSESAHRPAAGSTGANQFGAFQVRYPSAKQIAYVMRLLETRSLEGATPDQDEAIAGIHKGTTNLRQTSDLIDWLVAQPTLASPTAVPGFVSNPASDKQLGFIRSLANEPRDLSGNPDGRIHETVMDVLGGKQVSKREASDAITALLAAPKLARRDAVKAEIEIGVYRTPDGVIHRAYFGQQSGRILCKRLDPNATERSERWTYEGMAERFVTPADRMTLAEAKEFGRHHALCCVCGADLDDPNSVEAGIGPVCGGRV